MLPWLALMLPFGGFLVLSLFGDWIRKDREERGAGVLSCCTVLLSFLIAVATAFMLGDAGRDLEQQRQSLNLPQRQGPYLPFQAYLAVDWIDVSGLSIPVALLLDRLASVMMLVVTGVSFLIHVYSLGYMARDEDRVRYFSYLNLFVFFMLLLVMATNLLMVFVGWEGVGLCSYLLIGFWFKRPDAAAAAKKAFIVNRVGDAGLILGLIMAYHAFGTLDLLSITDHIGGLAPERLGELGIVTVIALLLFLGACGKSAQLPLHVWLPDAMEGPTPVSALIHASTMVTAGVYLVARLAPLYRQSETAMLVVAVIGVLTAFVAATIALVQTDIKKVLAYSTVSQLGFMFLACGVGAFGAAVFHLVTHAFFKALLFLSAGSVIHALGGEQDMRRMGGLARRLPWTFWTFVIGAASLAGLPFLAGFFSKDMILEGTFATGRTAIFVTALLAALLTAVYITRLVCLAFLGASRLDAEKTAHAHESPWVMTIPLVLLAVGSATAGFVPLPDMLRPVMHGAASESRAVRWIPYAATTLSLFGIMLAAYLYLLYKETPARLASALPWIRRALEAKWGFDDLYNAFVRRVLVSGGRRILWRAVDSFLIDGTVNATARAVGSAAETLRSAQTGLVRGHALLVLGGAVALVVYLLWPR
ncbi:MAG: NADH-quinone oxidoreductase subunit L [Vicinamibacteria bacterium]|nr:NADH-quinone oxidoreductase subunit L [Vicinamibacteria bacterium]